MLTHAYTRTFYRYDCHYCAYVICGLRINIIIIKTGNKELLFAKDQLPRQTGAPQQTAENETVILSEFIFIQQILTLWEDTNTSIFFFPLLTSDITSCAHDQGRKQGWGSGASANPQKHFLVIKSCYQAWDMDRWVRAFAVKAWRPECVPRNQCKSRRELTPHTRG